MGGTLCSKLLPNGPELGTPSTVSERSRLSRNPVGERMSIDGGGGASAGGAFALSGTIGQPDADLTLTGGQFTLVGGFWAGVAIGPPACRADFNHDGVANSQDFFDYLAAFFD